MGWDRGGHGNFPPYVPVAERRAKALRAAQRWVKKGIVLAPVKIEGRKIATTFWGNAWCDHLTSYNHFGHRLPKGRTYCCNGSIVHLAIEPGKITSLVSGSELYEVTLQIKPLKPAKWKAIRDRCAGQVGSLVELLQGKLSKHVMEIVTGQAEGLFPSPDEIVMSCSCPDYADVCKHVAATMYGVANRLDSQPELLFKLRNVDHLELITQAVPTTLGASGKGKKKRIDVKDLSDVFGIELDVAPTIAEPIKPPRKKRKDGAPKAK